MSHLRSIIPLRTASLSLSLILGVLLAISSSPQVSAADESLSEPAIAYLKHLANDSLDLPKHSALSKNCSAAKHTHIKEMLTLLHRKGLDETTTFKLSERKISGNFAAVLIDSRQPSRPLEVTFRALALLKQKGKWQVAPMPGSFTNTGYGYDPKVEATVKKLERWMALRKAKLETTARKDAASILLRNVATEETKAELNKKSPEESILGFIASLKERNTDAALAYLGAASNQLESDLTTCLDTLALGFNDKDPSGQWKLVAGNLTLIEVMKKDPTKKEIALGFYSPFPRNKARVIYFPYRTHEGKTFFSLPLALKAIAAREQDRWRMQWRNQRGDEGTLTKSLPSNILENCAVQPQPDAKTLATKFAQHINARDFRSSISLIPHDGKFAEDTKGKANTLYGLGNDWRMISVERSTQVTISDPISHKNWALSTLQYAQNKRSSKIVTREVWMHKSKGKWLLIPNDLLDSLDDDDQKTVDALKKRIKDQINKAKATLTASMLSKITTLPRDVAVKPMDPDFANKLLIDFRKHLRSKSLEKAMACCAVFDTTSSAKALKYFNYALRGANDHNGKDTFVFSKTDASKHWHCIALRTTSRNSGTHDYPYYVLINTADGPKIMLDIDLRYATNKGRELLNKKNWATIKEQLPAETARNLASLSSSLDKAVKARIDSQRPTDK